MSTAIFTIVSSNYLHFARTILQGVARMHPEADRYCVIVDADVTHAAAFADEFQVLHIDALGLPDARRFIFRYTILELNTAVKPWAIEHLIERGYDEVVYLDPDLQLFRPMDDVFALLADGANLVVMPHLLAPMTDDLRPTELDIRVAGTYNFGFCAVAARGSTRDFLRWWQSKLVRGCVVDLAAGVFVDQSWIDLVPGLFPGVAVLRHPGYNVAYWNLAQRPIERTDDGYLAAGQPLVFFHFSGFDPEKPERFSKHQNRYVLDTLGTAKPLALDYAALVLANGASALRRIPYGYGVFDDGTKLPDAFRRAYRSDEALEAVLGDDPFAHPEILSTVAAPSRPGHLAPTYAMQALWNERPDLRLTFPLTDDDSVARYYDWFVHGGGHEFSASTVAAHAAIHASIVEMLTVAAPAASAAPPVPVAPERGGPGDFVDRAYRTLLGRAPDAAGRDACAQTLDRGAGPLRVALAIGLSAESRARPGFAGRLATGLREGIGYWALGPEPVPAPAPASVSAPMPEGPTVRTLRAPRGWYVQDGDIATSGIWTAPDAALACTVDGPGELVIEGHYNAELIERQSGSPASTLSISLGGTRLDTTTIAASGPFALRVLVPADHARGFVELRIESSAFFVPSAIGLNDDRRQLAWRATRVQLGDEVLLDASRTPPILPLDAVARVAGVNVVGYLAAESGVGESVRSFARGCHAVGIRLHTFDVGYQNLNRQTDLSMRDLPNEAQVFDVSVLHVNADQTGATLAALPAPYRDARTTIAYWHWEQPALPLSALQAFEGLTEVWVPSAFVHDAVASIAPVPVFKVPHVIEFAVPTGDARARFGLPSDRFLVLTMYDFDSYAYRKNAKAAIDAYRQACGARRDAALVIKTINADRHPEAYRELLDDVADLEAVYCIDRYLDRADVHALEQACDGLISLHRSEGFGLALAEMMYLGKPVIGTGWSGNMEFMTPMNSFPVDYVLKPLAQRLGVYEAGQLWAEADVGHAAHFLSRIVGDVEHGRQVGRVAAAHMRQGFSANAIGRRYRKRLSVLALRRA